METVGMGSSLGTWSEAHVRRVFWRAGFGATPEEARRWAAAGQAATLAWLLNGDGPARLVGPAPSADGKPIDPVNEWAHDTLWWLDRMVRSTRPLEEKMTLFWHDHFATRDQDTPLMLRQNATLRAYALNSFPKLLREVTLDPAMQMFLNTAGSHKRSPNENYARELMELFALGSGYTEFDIRHAARALTGFVAVRENGRVTGVTYDPSRHDDGADKNIFGQVGAFGWEDVLKLCVAHPSHPGFLVGKLWDFFVPEPPDSKTARRLRREYVKRGMKIKPVLKGILSHPALYADLDKPAMVKSPVVYVAGLIRTSGWRVDRRAWVHLTSSMGQQLFKPPSVAGWEHGTHWMSTNSMRLRFVAANEMLKPGGVAHVPAGSVAPDLAGKAALASARAAVGQPEIAPRTRAALDRLLADWAAMANATHADEKVRRKHAEALQNALRHLIVSSPDAQLH
jgi:uncharacterized protein (DUF1800 family)